MAKVSEVIYTRFPPLVAAALRRRAENERRHISNQIELIVEDWLTANGDLPAKDKAGT